MTAAWPLPCATAGSSCVLDLAWSHDDSRLAVALRDGRVFLLDAGTGEPRAERQLTEGQVALVDWRLGADEFAWCGDPSGVEIIDGVTLATRRRFEGVLRPCAHAPSGRHLVVTRRHDRRPTILDADTGGARPMAEGAIRVDEGCRVRVAPDGLRLAAVLADGHVGIWNWRTGELEVTLAGSALAYGLAWHPTEPRLAVGTRQGEILIHETRTWSPLLALRGHEAYVYSLDWSPDGLALVSGSGDGTVRRWTAPADSDPGARRRARR